MEPLIRELGVLPETRSAPAETVPDTAIQAATENSQPFPKVSDYKLLHLLITLSSAQDGRSQTSLQT